MTDRKRGKPQKNASDKRTPATSAPGPRSKKSGRSTRQAAGRKVCPSTAPTSTKAFKNPRRGVFSGAPNRQSRRE